MARGGEVFSGLDFVEGFEWLGDGVWEGPLDFDWKLKGGLGREEEE